MKTQCPHCSELQTIPSIYHGKEVKCNYCKEPFSPKPHIRTIKVHAIITKICPYLGLSSLLLYPFVASQYAALHLVLLKYLCLCFALIGIVAIVKRYIKKNYPAATIPSSVILVVISCLLLYTYGKNDRRMEHRTEGNLDIYDTYTRWGFNLIYRRIYGHSDSNPNKLLISVDGPMASRPGSFYPQRHGFWEIHHLTSPPSEPRYEWYWYGDEITEDQWIVRTNK